MKEINPEEFPRNLTMEDIDLLADLIIENPVSEKWKRIAGKLTSEQKIRINKRVEIKSYYKTEALPSFNKKSIDDETWKDLKELNERVNFYGNMGEPTTPSEFKAKYGVWPSKE
ncbi:hypothetical protein MQE36_01205 [Zhouia spongiae]|uniref:Addiction module protein n=1 Tax=Zhouia spongiae TaxID=2202721 RepID=A0ABY3YMT7_9FLAO|nr:hypothetical protein [Zhouia spongiae]UNY98981.1 hypothetical protein MQE36_01205 [Zhouia spongiae]